MPGPLPLLKLVGLFVKTIAKPVANRMKVESSKHPNFSNVCITVGQFSHYINTRINVFATGFKFVGVKPLENEKALSEGIGFLSEAVVFTVAGGIIIYEVLLLYRIKYFLMLGYCYFIYSFRKAKRKMQRKQVIAYV